MSTHIHDRAVVSGKAKIGENVRIDAFVVVEDDVVIGDGTWVASHAIVANGARVGKDCKIFPGASIGHAPQDLKYKNEPTLLELGDRCTVREYVTLNRATTESGRTVIGNDCLFMANSHIGHDCRVGNKVIIANGTPVGGHVQIGDYAILGGLSPIHQFVHIGEHVMIGGGFRAVKDVPPFVLAGQEPLVFEGLNSIGLRRRGFTPKTLDLLDKAYSLLYRSKLNVSQAVARIKTDLELIPEIQSIIHFIDHSKRGIISGRSRR